MRKAQGSIVTTWDANKAIASCNKLIARINKLNANQGKMNNQSAKTTKGFNMMNVAAGVLAGVGLYKVFQMVGKVARGLLNLGKESLSYASTLEEMQNKFNVVFRGLEDRATQWADELVRSYAMSTGESRMFMSSMQDLFVPLGMNRDLAGELSFEMVKLAADLGSFNDMRTADVLRDMQSAAVGNFETMKKYSIILNETAIKQEAANLGFQVGKGVVDPLTKSIAAYSLMLKGSTDAQGDMARSSGSYANQLKKLQSRKTMLFETMGKHLLPVFAKLYGRLSSLAEYAMPYVEKASKWLGAALADLFGWVQNRAIPILIGFYGWLTDTTWTEKALQVWEIFKDYVHLMFTKVIPGVIKWAVTRWWEIMWGITKKVVPGIISWLWQNLVTGITNAFEWIRVTSYNIFIGMFNSIIVAMQNFVQKYILESAAMQMFLTNDMRRSLESFAWGHKTALQTIEGDYKKHTSLVTAILGEHQTKVQDSTGSFLDNLQSRGQSYFQSFEGDHDQHHTNLENRMKSAAEFAARIGSGGSGADHAHNYAHSWEYEWENDMVPTYEAAYDAFEDTSYQAGYNAGESQATGYQEGYESAMSGWDATQMGGFTGMTGGGLQTATYNGKKYYSRDGQSWFSGNIWDPFSLDPAPPGFYDWLAGQQSAHKGGFVDAFAGKIVKSLPSFDMGGLARDEMIAKLHHKEFVFRPEAVEHYGVDTLVQMNERKKEVDGGNTYLVVQGNVFDIFDTTKLLAMAMDQGIGTNEIRMPNLIDKIKEVVG